MDIFTTEFIRIPTSFFVKNFMAIETAAAARDYLGIGGGTGDVTNTGALTLNQLVVGNGGVDIKVLASPANATRFLNGAATPAFAQVKDSDLSISDITTNDVSITKHGFAPKLPNDPTVYLDGEGNYTTPTAGSGSVTNTGTLTDHGVIVGNGGVDVSAISVGSTNTVLHGNTGADPSFSAVVEADITLADNTTNNVSSTKHGLTPKSPADPAQFLNGGATPAFALVKDSDLSTSDITTNNVTTAKHGFAPKLPNDATKFLDGTGAYTTPPGGSATPGGSDKNVQYNDTGAFGGVPNNSTANNKFLRQVSSGTPSFEAVTDADLSTSDITTNNATTAKHGFLKKLSNSATDYMDGTGNWSTPAGGGGTDYWYDWIMYELVPAGATTSDATNVSRTESAATTTRVGASGTVMELLNYATTGSSGNSASVGTTQSTQFPYFHQLQYFGWFQPIDNTSSRYWIGLTSNTVATQGGADVPTGSYAMFRYSTAAPDTNYQAVINNGSSNETIDTGVAASVATLHKFEIRWDGTTTGKVKFYIDGSLVVTSTIDLGATDVFGFRSQITTLANSAKNFRCGGQKCRVKYF